MDRKAWLWKKRSSDKVAAAPDLHDHHVQDENIAPNTTCRSSGEVPEENIKLLNEKLAAAQAELAAKQESVNQHIKVAEEAVSGWEKSESEAASLKKQLEEAGQEKAALEDRAAHLDNGLKECVRQLRLLREEQENKIKDAVTREREEVRLELTTQLADLTNQLVQEGAKSHALSKSLQERSRAVVELSDAKLQAEKESRYFQTRLETIEKDYKSLQYDFQVLQKEFEISNQENECNKKMLDAANKQQLEAVKKNAKLEAEVQRLRMLVKKKLPGPAALCEMRMEVGESRSTSERMRSMEEEATLLKEVLAKRNEELQEAKLTSAKYASQLSSLEQELKLVKANQVKNGSTPVEGGRRSITNRGSYGLLDDFLEMERLALIEQGVPGVRQECAELRNKLASAEEQLKQKQAEIFTANYFDPESRARLRSAVCKIIHLVESMANEYAGIDSSAPEMDITEGVQRLVSVSKNLLQGKVPILDFVSELPQVLDFVVGLTSGSSTLESSGSRRSSIHKTAEDVIHQLKSDVSELESKLRAARETIQDLSSELSRTQEEARALKVTIAATEEEKEAAVRKLASMATLKNQLEERLKSNNAEACQLRESLESLKGELQKEQRLRQDAENKLVYQQHQACPSKEESFKLQKERELAAAAERLAECQRTILMLGKQLESLGMQPAEDKNASRALEEQTAEYQHIQKQETYWSSVGLNQLDDLLCGCDGEPFEVKTPMRHQQQRRSKICHGSSEMSKPLDAGLPPEKHGLARLFSRVKGHH